MCETHTKLGASGTRTMRGPVGKVINATATVINRDNKPSAPKALPPPPVREIVAKSAPPKPASPLAGLTPPARPASPAIPTKSPAPTIEKARPQPVALRSDFSDAHKAKIIALLKNAVESENKLKGTPLQNLHGDTYSQIYLNLFGGQTLGRSVACESKVVDKVRKGLAQAFGDQLSSISKPTFLGLK